jgi:hypothetical protein
VLQAIRRLSTDSGFGVITDNTPPTSKLLKLTPK